MTSTDIERASRDFRNAAESATTLYTITAEYVRLLDLADDPETDPAEVEAELERVAGDINRKAYGIGVVLGDFGHIAEQQRSEAKRLTEKARLVEAHIERLKDYTQRCMEQLGVKRIETGVHTFAIRQNPPSVVVLDAAAVPGEFTRTTITVDVDKRGILAAFKESGEIPPGVNVVRTESLRIT